MTAPPGASGHGDAEDDGAERRHVGPEARLLEIEVEVQEVGGELGHERVRGPGLREVAERQREDRGAQHEPERSHADPCLGFGRIVVSGKRYRFS